MATGISDFEKYPKYLLNKHGKIIQNILSNAESVFNMDAVPGDDRDPIAIQAPIKGGENLHNANGVSPVFKDAFAIHEDTTTGIKSVGLDLDGISEDPEIKMAIAEFATVEDINSIFTHLDPDGEPIIETKPLPQPIISLIADNTTQFSITNGSITEDTAQDLVGLTNYLLHIYEDDISNVQDSPEYWPTIRQFMYIDQVTETDPLIVDAPEITASPASRFQKIYIQAIGDDFNSNSSVVVANSEDPQDNPDTSNIIRLQLATPIISEAEITGSAETEEHTYTITKPDAVGFINTSIDYFIRTQQFDYKKAENTITITPLFLEEPSVSETVNIGKAFQCYTVGNTTQENIQVLNSPISETKALYSALQNPPTLTTNGVNCSVTITSNYRDQANGVPFYYTQKIIDGTTETSETIALPITFVCEVKQKGVDVFDPAFEVQGEIIAVRDSNGEIIDYQDVPIVIYLKDGDTINVYPKVDKYTYFGEPASITIEKIIPEDPDVIDLNDPAVSVQYYDLTPGWSNTNI